MPPAVDLNTLANFLLLGMLVALAASIALTRNLLAAVLLMGVYSLVSAIWLVVLDAPDVAFTEAVVGAGVSTIITLGAILLTRAECAPQSVAVRVVALCVATGVGVLLAMAAFDLPAFGDPASPANAHVGRYYLEHTKEEVGPPNVVTAVLASYRGFDTLGETTVIFAAGLAVALLLGFGERALADAPLELRDAASPALADSDHHVVLSVAARILTPLIALFAFYTLFHGDLGAGGGFQAGVILAAAILLHGLVFGLHDVMSAFSASLVRSIASLGVLLYAGVGVMNLLNGGRFLDYDFLFPEVFEAGLPDSAAAGGHHHWGQHFGILIIETGVLMTVAATLVSIFYAFAGRAPEAELLEDAP